MKTSEAMKNQEPLFETPAPDMDRSAYISDCGMYRYTLKRVWNGALPLVCIVMLNPSTADATKDDPTIRRCMGYARAWGYGGVIVVNLFAWRATKPADLFKASDPVGVCNDQCVLIAASQAQMVVAAWGTNGAHQGRAEAVTRFLTQDGRTVHCLAVTKGGHPRHPLYLRADLVPVPFVPVQAVESV